MIEVDASLYGRNLKQLMEKRSVTVKRLHEITGISPSIISYYRCAKVMPTSINIQIIAKALRFDVGEFFKE